MFVPEMFEPIADQLVKPDVKDSALPVKFEYKSQPNPKFGKVDGALPRINQVYIHIFMDGGMNVYNQPAVTNSNDVPDECVIRDAEGLRDDAKRFPRQWKAFIEGRGEEILGTPLSILFPRDPAKVENYAHFHIKTVEQLAGASAPTLQSCGGGSVADQQSAKAFLEGAREQKQDDLNEKLGELETEKEFLMDQVKDLVRQVEELRGLSRPKASTKSKSAGKKKQVEVVEEESDEG